MSDIPKDLSKWLPRGDNRILRNAFSFIGQSILFHTLTVSIIHTERSCDHQLTFEKMASKNLSFQQRAVIEFFVCEGVAATDNHRCLQIIYGDVTLGASPVK